MVQYLKLRESDIHKITSKYELNPVDYEPIEEGAGNTSYLVRTTKNQYVLTIFEIEQIRVAKLCKLLYLLEEFDFPTTRIQKLANGDKTTNYQGKPVLLKPYIIGHVKKQLDENMVSQIGEVMAILHEIPNPDFLPARHAYGLQTFPRVMEKGINQEYENWLAQRYDYLKNNIPVGLSRGLIHGDLFYDNVLFDGKEFKAIIDFEEACQYYKLFDLGMAVVGLCTKDSKVKLNKVRSLVKGYQRIRILEEQEKGSLQLFVEYAAIATSSLRFWKYNIDTPIAEESDKYMQMVNIANNAGAIPNALFMSTIFA